MNINVPEWAREHFWEDTTVGDSEFWAFRYQPKVKVGDTLRFRFDGKIVAQAIVAAVEPPGESSCLTSGKFLHRWKVVWRNESFVDLREKDPTLAGL